MKLAKPLVYHVTAINTLTITNVSGLRYEDATGERIACEFIIKELGLEVIPFTAFKYDSAAHGREIYNDLVAGKFGKIAEFKPE